VAGVGACDPLAVRHELLHIDPASYRSHPLHLCDRAWTETNCYADFWIEALHTLGRDPVAGLAFTLEIDFEGDQWTMFKYPTADLQAIYGLRVNELNVWRDLGEHVEEQLSLGHGVTIDADAWFLPDTRDVTYRIAHQKTTIMAQMVDLDGRELGYFHNAAYFELDGDDFDGVLRRGPFADPILLPPYVEAIRIDDDGLRGDQLVQGAIDATRAHLAHRPTTNPFPRFRKQLESDLDWLVGSDLEVFHRYAFGTCRQCGSGAELAAAFTRWLVEHDHRDLSEVAAGFTRIAAGSKSLQFGLARRMRGRAFDLDEPFAAMADAWEAAMATLVDLYGS
jgi:hypothetical protein